MPSDPAGVETIGPILMTPDAENLCLRIPQNASRPLPCRRPEIKDADSTRPRSSFKDHFQRFESEPAIPKRSSTISFESHVTGSVFCLF